MAKLIYLLNPPSPEPTGNEHIQKEAATSSDKDAEERRRNEIDDLCKSLKQQRSQSGEELQADIPEAGEKHVGNLTRQMPGETHAQHKGAPDEENIAPLRLQNTQSEAQANGKVGNESGSQD